MSNLVTYAQNLIYSLLSLMPSPYQKNSKRTLLGLFLEATGQSVPQHSQTVSPSALSRFLNKYNSKNSVQLSVQYVLKLSKRFSLNRVVGDDQYCSVGAIHELPLPENHGFGYCFGKP